ncbi:acyl-CoA dehydrogenase [Achromobacter sp. SIMBA_011]|jgi:alkylation response protein AidB-like acyl-CoA dehydrogenase|nr:acyl-CoA dehydrogenase [Achromobacter xylosoxidans]EFV86216.1 hypothetical protein HMPREF0005_02599 [Achromobacter xylosoxidans C54]
MNFDLEDDQRALVDTLNRLVSKEYSFEQRQRYARHSLGWSPDVWNSLAEIGLLALPFSEEDGGLGGTPTDLMLAAQALGKGALLEPFISSIVLCGGALKYGASIEQRAQWIPRLADGSLRLAMAHTEAGTRFVHGGAATRADRISDQWRLTGRKTLVLHGDSADGFLVTAQSARAGGVPSRAIFHVNGDAAGLLRTPYTLLDGTRSADIILDGVDAQLVVKENAEEVLGLVACDGAGIAIADAVGSMQVLIDLTVDYLKTRRQFGRAIGSFQALQHRAVDMLVELEQARSMSMYATMAADAPLAERCRAISAAKIQICASSRFISQQAIQLHGGIGMTEEYQVGHFVRRLMVLESLFGDKNFHMKRLSATEGVFSTQP